MRCCWCDRGAQRSRCVLRFSREVRRHSDESLSQRPRGDAGPAGSSPPRRNDRTPARRGSRRPRATKPWRQPVSRCHPARYPPERYASCSEMGTRAGEPPQRRAVPDRDSGGDGLEAQRLRRECAPRSRADSSWTLPPRSRGSSRCRRPPAQSGCRQRCCRATAPSRSSLGSSTAASTWSAIQAWTSSPPAA